MLIILLFLILILIGSWILLPEKKHNKSVDTEILNQKFIMENITLRNTIQSLEKKLNAIIYIKEIIQQVAPIFKEEILFDRLSKTDLTPTGIDKLIIFLTNKENTLNPIVHPKDIKSSQVQQLSMLLNELYKDILKTKMKQTISKNQLYIEVPNITQKIEEIIPQFFILTPLVFEQKLIGICLFSTESLSFGESQIFTEISELFATHLAYIIKNVQLYQKNQLKQRELEQAVNVRTQQLQDVLEEVSHINKSKSEFVSTVAHELRTSLTAIKGFASLIYQGKLGAIPLAIQERIGKILNQVNRLVDMVNTMLDINKIESGKIEMSPTLINVNQLLNNVIDTFLAQIQTKHLTVTIKAPHNLFIYADSIYMERVIYNLISNAIKFTPYKGEIQIKAILKTKNKVLLTIKDTGIGIAEKDIPYIFKEFYHVDHPELTNIRGIGLGLSLVKKIIDGHRAKIWVESELKKGTTFHILIKGMHKDMEEIKDVQNANLR